MSSYHTFDINFDKRDWWDVTCDFLCPCWRSTEEKRYVFDLSEDESYSVPKLKKSRLSETAPHDSMEEIRNRVFKGKEPGETT